MNDLERKIEEAFEKLAKENDMPINKYWCDDGTDNQYENPETSDAYNFYRDGFNKSIELAQDDINELKQKLAESEVKQNMWRDEKNHAIKRWHDITQDYNKLKQKLERLESGDYILVPKQLLSIKVSNDDTEILDNEISQMSSDLSETCFLSNEQEEDIEMLVAKSMKLGELYERKKFQQCVIDAKEGQDE